MKFSLRLKSPLQKQEDRPPRRRARSTGGPEPTAHAGSPSPPYLRNQPALLLGEASAPQPAPQIQPKLAVGQTGDGHEREADRVADRVMCASEPTTGGLGRFRAGDNSEPAAAATTTVVQQALGSTGEPLDAGTRTFMETRFGQDFSRVRVHADDASAQSARAIGARAYTVGSDVVFGAGQYAPQSADGRRLLAHELTHTIQQRGGLRIQRQPLKEELDKELAEWAAANSKSIDPKNSDYAFNLQEYAWSLINVSPDTIEPIPKPKDKKAAKEWEKKFKKAQLLVGMILAAGDKVTQKEERAGMILNLTAQAGFIAESVEAAKGLTKFSEAAVVFGAVLDQVEKADAKSLTTITEAFIKEKGATDNPIIEKLTDSSGSFEKRLTKDQLTAILKPLVNKFEAEPFIIDLLSEVLVHRADYRKTFSDWMWKEKKGEFLFKLLESKYFIEPEYGPTTFREVGELELEKDMPWVYANKQKFYVGYLVQLGAETGVAIRAPKNLKIATLRKWLDENTEKIGEAAAKKYPTDPDQLIKIFEQLADIFFYHVDGRDIKPDLTGKLAKLKPAAPKKMRLEADCDVLATYAMRYFKSIRDPANPDLKTFDPVGYIALDPEGEVGHAAALMRRDKNYYVISNKQVFKTNVEAEEKDDKKEDAIKALRDEALEVYNTKPTNFKVFYADSPDGAMPKALAQTEASTRRPDLE